MGQTKVLLLAIAMSLVAAPAADAQVWKPRTKAKASEPVKDKKPAARKASSARKAPAKTAKATKEPARSSRSSRDEDAEPKNEIGDTEVQVVVDQ